MNSCKIIGASDLYCKIGYNFGSSWSVVQGSDDGVTQMSNPDPTNKYVWNYPLNVSFKSTTPSGWPQIVMAIYGRNTFGNDVVAGYGAYHIPTRPGHHEITIPIFVPASSSILQSIVGWFSGVKPEFINLNFIAGSDDRELIRTESHGYIKVVFDVAIYGLEANNLIVN